MGQDLGNHHGPAALSRSDAGFARSDGDDRIELPTANPDGICTEV